MGTSEDKPILRLRFAAGIILLVGIMSVIGGGAVLSGGDEAQLTAGPYANFVEWFNFVGGFIYLVTGAGLWTWQRWTAPLAFLIALATVLVCLAVGLHVAGGASQDMRLVVNTGLRSVLWLVISPMAWRWIWRSK